MELHQPCARVAPCVPVSFEFSRQVRFPERNMAAPADPPMADLLGVPVVRPKVVETTALGAAYLAGLAVGFWKSHQEVHTAWQADRTFTPRRSADEVAHRRSRWAEALNRARGWEERSEYKEPPRLH